MGLFDKKFCDICGEKISLLGNRKLEDGNMCSACAKKISPFMTDRRKTTVAEMKEHLEYREQNKAALSSFRASVTYGDSYSKLCVDRAAGKFYVGPDSQSAMEKENPDILAISSVTSCKSDLKEHRQEIYAVDSQGNKCSYSPPRYKYDYDFYIDITVDSPWFSDIEFKLNSSDIEERSMRFRHYEDMANQIVDLLTSGRAGFNANPYQQPQQTYAQPATAAAWFCPNCGAQSSGRFCQNCGTQMPVSKTVRCDKCGWTPEPGTAAPRFCPNCGDPINELDFN